MALVATEPAWSEPAYLRVRGLSVSYGPVTALEGVDLEVQPGEVVGAARDHGAGKSTLRCLCGDRAGARGEVRWDGEPIALRPPRSLRGAIGSVATVAW